MNEHEEMGENLRIYTRQLATRLKAKEEEFSDLQRRFSRLRGHFDQLDYAFKKNLQLHQQQMIAIRELHLSQKELRKVDKDRWKQFQKLEDQLIQVNDEKEAIENGLAYWKQAAIDQKIFYEGKFEECLRECETKMEADSIVHQRILKETESIAEKRVQELANRCKLNEEEGEVMKKRAIILQGDVDVLRHRTEGLASSMANFTEMNENLQPISTCIIKILRSLSTPHDDYDKRMKELREEFVLQQIPRPEANPEGNTSDYETLRSQNLVLREVVKKLKNELTKVRKSEAIVSKPLVEENPQTDVLMKKLIELDSKNKNLCDLLDEKDAELRKSEKESEKNIAKLEMNLKIMKSRENEEERNFSETHIDLNNSKTRSKGVNATEEKFVTYTESRKGREFNDDRSQEAYWGLQEEQVKNYGEEATGDMMKSLELNLEALNSGQSSEKNYVTLKDKQKVEAENTRGYLNPEKNEGTKINQSQLDPIESHLNSIRYKEYTISLSKHHSLKIRYPIARKSLEKISRLRSVYSEKEYQSTPIDEAVLFFDCENDEPIIVDSKMTNCAIQTVPISTENVFTQTTASKETFNGQGRIGVTILNSERRAIERSLQDLERTVSETGKEALGLARCMIVKTSKFPPSEEFFDCIKYLSQCRTT